MLAHAANTELSHEVDGTSVEEVLGSLFTLHPGLRGHIVDEGGAVRPHVSVFVDGAQATVESVVNNGSEVRIIQAVSGG
jgi:hypothetical protein